MSTDRHVPRPPAHRPVRLALRITDASASGIIDASELRAEPLVPALAATLARARHPAPMPPRRRTDPWALAMLYTAWVVAVAFMSVVAAARLAPGMATERARAMDGHLSMHAASTSTPTMHATSDAASLAKPRPR